MRTNMIISVATIVVLWTVVPSVWGQSPFAAEVVDFSPAPGQFVNVPEYDDPSRALGPPVGGGLYNPDNTSLVSLGGFGGSITLAFDHTVMDDATNPSGLDAIVFGNAHWVGGNPNRRWAECGAIEISRDVNGNGQADDPWYLIPGSHIADPPGQWEARTWDDDVGDPTYPPTHPAWVPPGRSGVWTTEGYRLPPAVFDVLVLENPNGLDAEEEGVFGYADLTPTLILGDLDADNIVDDPDITPAQFYVVPDDPFEVGMTPGSGGGDALDIAWAIDPETGQASGMDGFDFIRITNGVDFIAAIFNESSPEIGGVADVLPGEGDMNCDGLLDGRDIGPFVMAILDAAAYEQAHGGCRWLNADIDRDGEVGASDVGPFVAKLTGDQE